MRHKLFLGVHKAPISKYIQCNMFRVLPEIYTPQTCTFDPRIGQSKKINSEIGRFPVYRTHLVCAICCNCFQLFVFFGGVHKVRLVFRKITHHKHCNVETTFWHENAAISKRSQHLTNTRILGTFLFWENMRSCGSKRETMRNKEKLMRNNGKQWE